MLFSSASAMASCAVRYSLPARTRSRSRPEFASRTGGTSGARYGRQRMGAEGRTGSIESLLRRERMRPGKSKHKARAMNLRA